MWSVLLPLTCCCSTPVFGVVNVRRGGQEVGKLWKRCRVIGSVYFRTFWMNCHENVLRGALLGRGLDFKSFSWKVDSEFLLFVFSEDFLLHPVREHQEPLRGKAALTRQVLSCAREARSDSRFSGTNAHLDSSAFTSL